MPRWVWTCTSPVGRTRTANGSWELESVAMQADLLEGLSDPAQTAMLESTVSGIRDGSLVAGPSPPSWMPGSAGDANRLHGIAEREFSRLDGPVGA